MYQWKWVLVKDICIKNRIVTYKLRNLYVTLRFLHKKRAHHDDTPFDLIF